MEMDENVEHKMRAALKGRVPWNKGRQMSEATREKMRSAKMGKKHTLATRRKMSMTHTGKTHSTKTIKKLSQRLRGVAKSAEHRMKISASQKRRHAANRALQAIEETLRDSEGPCGTRWQQTTPSPWFTAYFQEKVDRKLRSREKTRADVRDSVARCSLVGCSLCR